MTESDSESYAPLSSGTEAEEEECIDLNLFLMPQPNIQAQLAYEAHLRHLREILDSLREQERQCVVLYAKGHTFREIARTMNLPYWKALEITKNTLIKIRHRLCKKPPGRD